MKEKLNKAAKAIKTNSSKWLDKLKAFFISLFIKLKVFFIGSYNKIRLKLKGPQKQQIEEALSDLKKEIVFLDLFSIILNSAIGFLAGLLIVVVFNIGWEYAFVPAAVVFIYYTIVYFRQRKLLLVEDRVPELSERLRTAADNIQLRNEITEDLKKEVVHDMKKVQTTYFIDLEGVGVRLFSIAIISFIIVILSFLNLTFDFEFAPVIQNPVKYIQQMAFPQDVNSNASIAFNEGNLSAAFGNKTSLVKLGDEELQLQVNPLQSELNFDQINEAQQQNFNPPVYPKEIYTSYDASYTEKIAKKNQAVVKSYFEQISK